MNRLRIAIGGLSAITLMVLATGCQSYARSQERSVGFYYPHARGETTGETPEEHYQRMSRVSALNSRALVEDIDLLFLSDRGTRLTRWHDK